MKCLCDTQPKWNSPDEVMYVFGFKELNKDAAKMCIWMYKWIQIQTEPKIHTSKLGSHKVRNTNFWYIYKSFFITLHFSGEMIRLGPRYNVPYLSAEGQDQLSPHVRLVSSDGAVFLSSALVLAASSDLMRRSLLEGACQDEDSRSGH